MPRREPRQKRRADPGDPGQVEGARRRALALAGHYARLAEVLAPPAPPDPAVTAEVARRLAAMLPAERARVEEQLAEQAAQSQVTPEERAEREASEAEERRAAIEAINAAWATHRGRVDAALLAEHDIIRAIIAAANPDPDFVERDDETLARLRKQWPGVAHGRTAEESELAGLRERWPDLAIDPVVFGEAVAAWRNNFKRGPAVAHLLHRAGLRDDTDAARRAVQRTLENHFRERPGPAE